ncbi:hypothetical protein AQ1_02522 [alpha proteobacterium Q-1]|nr:hypothetical protein AQ1_02522 [alpha proteobacterium Q-1]
MNIHRYAKRSTVTFLFGVLGACSSGAGSPAQPTVPLNLSEMTGVEERKNGCFVMGSDEDGKDGSSSQVVCPTVSSQDNEDRPN